MINSANVLFLINICLCFATKSSATFVYAMYIIIASPILKDDFNI